MVIPRTSVISTSGRETLDHGTTTRSAGVLGRSAAIGKSSLDKGTIGPPGMTIVSALSRDIENVDRVFEFQQAPKSSATLKSTRVEGATQSFPPAAQNVVIDVSAHI